MHRISPLVFALLLFAIPVSAQSPSDGSTIVVKNNHDAPYRGPLTFETNAQPGSYQGDLGSGTVHDGIARLTLDLMPGAEAVLEWDEVSRPDDRGVLAAASGADGRLILGDENGDEMASLEFGLVVIPGTKAGPADAVEVFEPLSINWQTTSDGGRTGTAEAHGYRVEFEARAEDGWRAVDGTWLGASATVTRTGGADGDAYVALIRRVTTPGVEDVHLRWNGREVDDRISPDYWERDFWYTRGVDWTRWSADGHVFLAVNGFTPSPIIVSESGKRHLIANHFYVWERTHAADDAVYLISEIAGPNPEQVRSRYMPVRPYTQPTPADTLQFKWRLISSERTAPQWEDGQLLGFTGFLRTSETDRVTRVDLGVPYVEFGTSYFPYSSFNENFDYYRTPGLDKETWWPFSAEMWSDWEEFIPLMKTDLRIIKSMGFEWVRLHYAGHLTRMPREEAIAYLDYYMDEARTLGLKVLTDSEGPAEWLALIAGRYSDVLKRVELENEVLIGGIAPEDPARWSALYEAIKDEAPDTQVFLTGAGANGMFEQLLDLGVPFDRVGLHAYKHGTGGKDAFSSHALGTAAYARSIGLEATLGEFNWKEFTRLSPEDRQEEFRITYEEMLETRSIPEFYQFHFQETMCVNPSISRSGIRHYETISFDRRPKPEAFELMDLIREHARPDAPFQELRVEIPEVVLSGGSGMASFTIVNETDKEIAVSLGTESFGGISASLDGTQETTIAPGASLKGSIQLRLGPNAQHGTYHHFLVAEFDGRKSYGWGVASSPGAPHFSAEPLLGDRVDYAGGPGIVEELDYVSRPLAVAFGPDAAKLELEMGYIITNTLQSATGRPVRLSSTDDLPARLRRDASLILVGTSETNPLINPAGLDTTGGHGVVAVQEATAAHPRALVFTGGSAEAVQAAATDFVLRYWQNAKDSAIRIAGMEPGSALGNPVGITNPDPP